MVDVMPQLFFFGLLGAAAYLGFSKLKEEAVRVSERNRRSAEEVKTGAHGTLVRGADGVYRVQRD